MKKTDWKAHATILITTAGMLLIAGCASTRMAKCEDHPGWVEQGGGFFGGDRDTAVYGVGVATNTGNTPISALRTTSDTRARADIASTILTNVEEMTKIYMGHVSDSEAEQYEEIVKNGLITFTKMDLVGAAITNHHNCPRDKGYYALARMDPGAFSDTIEKMQDLNDKAREIIEENSEEVFDEMAQRAGRTQ